MHLKVNRNHVFFYGLIAVCCVIEGVLTLSDYGILVPKGLRTFVYFFGAFWPGLLDNWKPNYAAQPYAMFVTHGLLHGGFLHLTVNMITLWSLGTAVLNRVNQMGFVTLYITTTLGGACVFALLAPSLRPMVGASGALFGLLGAILAWDYLSRQSNQESVWSTARSVLLLIALNLVLWWTMDGQLAWQAHLGGFVTGWAVALLFDRYKINGVNL